MQYKFYNVLVLLIYTNIRKDEIETDIVDKMAKVARFAKVAILQFIFFRVFRTLPFGKPLAGRNFP